MDIHLLHCGSCFKLLLGVTAGVVFGCWWITWRFAWFFIMLWHIIEAIVISGAIAAVATALILIAKAARMWWRKGHPLPMPAFPDLKARKLRVKPQEVPQATPEHVYVVTDAAPGRKFNGMQG